ncbi:MAG: peptidoglycan-binding domain-containing protein [Minisyncoccia bacterium]
MDKRTRKQIIIALVFFTLFTLVGGGIYLITKPTPTCFDNKQNGKETGVDCGGSCIPCDLKNNPPLTLQKSPLFFVTSNQKIDILLTLINTNTTWGAKSFSYTLTLQGAKGETQNLTFSDFINPQEIKNIVLPQVSVNFVPQSISFTLDPKSIIWAQPIKGIDVSLGNLFPVNGVTILTPIDSTQINKNTYTFTKTLRLGMKDPEVYNLQKVLSQTPSIYPEGKVTGTFDKATEAAVKRFQEKYGIRITGEVGPQTRQKLNELYGSKNQQPFSYTFDTKKVLKRGMKGIDITNLQQALGLDSGYNPPGMVSGTFDKATENAVKAFQAKYNLPVTGQVDKATATKLNDLFSSIPTTNPQLTSETFYSYEATLKVKGNLYNSSPFSWKNGEVAVVLCDNNKNPAVVGKVPLSNIILGKSLPFAIIWHNEVPNNLIICASEAHINILDLDNAFVAGK